MSSNPDSQLNQLHPDAQRGLELFNRGKYFEAHEHLELAWMGTPSPERDLYQGLLQVGVGYFQIERGNYRGALKMFKRGRRNLQPLPDQLLGIDIAQLLVDAHRVESTLRSLGPARIGDFDTSIFQEIPLMPEA